MNETNLYVFSFEATVSSGGVIGSKLSEEETKSRVAEELNETFGEGKVNILEFRAATPEESEEFAPYIQESLGTEKKPLLN